MQTPDSNNFFKTIEISKVGLITSDNKYPNGYDRSELESLSQFYRTQLFDNTLPFWLPNCLDDEHGGYWGSLDQDGTIVDTDKSVWQQGRFSWLLGKLCNLNQDVCQNSIPDWGKASKTGVEFISNYCVDTNDGRMWFHVTREGIPLRKRRYSFGESFAAISFGEQSKLQNSSELGNRAMVFFQEFVEQNLNPKSSPKFTGQRPTRSIGFPMILIVTAQELRNSLADHQPREYFDHWIDFSIDLIKRFHIKSDIECVMETVAQDGNIIDHFDGRTLNPGHAIEASWFILAESVYRNDIELRHLGCQILDWMWERGWDNEYGGIKYFTDVFDKPVQEYWHDMKFWWPHNETIIATLVAFLLTGDQKYARWHRMCHDWAHEHFADTKFGEWFGYLRRDGTVSSSLKGNMWKGPFHLPRMQLVCWQILERFLSDQPIFAVPIKEN